MTINHLLNLLTDTGLPLEADIQFAHYVDGKLRLLDIDEGSVRKYCGKAIIEIPREDVDTLKEEFFERGRKQGYDAGYIDGHDAGYDQGNADALGVESDVKPEDDDDGFQFE